MNRATAARALRWGIIAFAVGLAAVAATFRTLSPDLFWHLKLGRDLIESGLSPLQDRYSFTFEGQSVKMMAWPFQMAVAAFYDAFGGIKGVAVLRLLLWLGAIAANTRLILSITKRSSLLALGLAFVLFTIVYHTEPRPDHVSLLLEPILATLLFRWRREPSNRRALGIGLLLWAWSNVHVSSVMGYVLAGAFWLDVALARAGALAGARAGARARWAELLATGFAWCAVGFLNADLLHPLLQQATLSPEWAEYVTEYERVPFAAQFDLLKLYWICLALTLPLLVIRREWAGLIVVSVIGLKTADMTKLFPHLTIMTLPFLIASYEWLLEAAKARGRVVGTAASLGVAALAIVAGARVTYRVAIEPVRPLSLDLDADYFPIDVVARARMEGLSGRAINEYGWGGYLIHELGPGLKVHVDGRSNVLYPLEHVKLAMEMHSSAETLAREALRYNVDFVFARAGDGAGLAHSALISGLFGLRDVGHGYAAIFERAPGRMPLASQLFLRPECLSKKMTAGLKAERALAAEGSPLRAYYDVAIVAAEGNSDPAAEIALDLTSPFAARLAAEVLWRRGDLAGAARVLSKLSRQIAADVANAAEIDCALTSCRNAEALLDHMPSVGMTPLSLLRARALLRKIESNQGLRIFTPERVARLDTRIKALSAREQPNGDGRSEGCP